MKRFICFTFLFLIIITTLYGCQNDSNNNDSDNENSANINSTNETNTSLENNSINLNTNILNNEVKKEEISSFSTKLLKDYSDKDRDSNIKLACSTLDGTIVNSKETFSFWDTIGNPTEDKGYKEAKAFDSDGDIIEAYGGGLCQISTTLYNAVLDLDDFEIVERHPHSNDVPYIKEGKDAAVSYSSSDLKFRNNSDYDIEIEAEVENNKINIRILKI